MFIAFDMEKKQHFFYNKCFLTTSVVDDTDVP